MSSIEVAAHVLVFANGLALVVATLASAIRTMVVPGPNMIERYHRGNWDGGLTQV